MQANDIKKTLRKYRLSPKKRFGQNFLVHQHIADRIVDLSGVTPQDSVIEVGVGLGALTNPPRPASEKRNRAGSGFRNYQMA